MGVTEHTIWQTAGSIIAIAFGVYLFMIIIMIAFQPRLVYFPTPEILSTPEEIGLSYENVIFKTSDGITLSGWYIPVKQSSETILFCHGNAGNISYRLDSIHLFHQLGLNTFIFDYRGYGLSEGKPSERGTYIDAEAAWSYLIREKQVKPSNIIIFGRSLGGAIAAHLAEKHTPKAVIIESAFTSVPEIGSELYPFVPVKLVSRMQYNTKKYLQQVHCPLLIVHSRDDEIIPFHHGLELFEKANMPKKFLEIIGDHNNGFIQSGKIYRKGIRDFISMFSEKNFEISP